MTGTPESLLRVERPCHFRSKDRCDLLNNSQFKVPGEDLQDDDHNGRASTHYLQMDGGRYAVSGTEDV